MGKKRKNSGCSITIGGWGVGAALAAVLSYHVNHSVGWAIVHMILDWLYVLYYCVEYLK